MAANLLLCIFFSFFNGFYAFYKEAGHCFVIFARLASCYRDACAWQALFFFTYFKIMGTSLMGFQNSVDLAIFLDYDLGFYSMPFLFACIGFLLFFSWF